MKKWVLISSCDKWLTNNRHNATTPNFHTARDPFVGRKGDMHRIAALAILANQAAHAMAMCATEDSTAYAAGASAGVACQFPFSYLGVSYTECIFDSTADSATPWCAVAGWGSPSASVTWGLYVLPNSCALVSPSCSRMSWPVDQPALLRNMLTEAQVCPLTRIDVSAAPAG